MQEYKDLDAIPENMEMQFFDLIDNQRDSKRKNQLRATRDMFKFHEFELDYDRDARKNIEDSVCNYVSDNLHNKKPLTPDSLTR